MLLLVVLALCGCAFAHRPVCTPDLETGTKCKLDPIHFNPTQQSLGYQYAIHSKLAKVNGKSSEDSIQHYLHNHEVPVVLFDNKFYITDHHHLSWAMLHSKWEGQQLMYCTVICNLQNYTTSQFWTYMKEQAWVYLTGNTGQPITPDDLPATLDTLLDDPYRSLSGFVKYHGFEKTCADFSEFTWGNFFRTNLPGLKPNATYQAILGEQTAAINLARSSKAAQLPGYVAPPTVVVHNEPDCPMRECVH
eukprot:NODE_189_length_1236_cov_429.799820_g185_i0.p1 GENE.NODE_189_length_1236_cov_429.799820_g185_i0~~NODE_189_length_1236_cov_429.799820_g185_i0.p1  ORF type:complete len:266 (-),score=62.43 NODE_189_length_1236_cov_429.799820_g185_i0:437-1180(-)